MNNLSIDSGWAALGVETLVFLAALVAGWTKMNAKINGFGGRLRDYEKDCAKIEGELKQLAESLTETKLLFVAQVGEVKNSISDKNSILGERIARLEPKGGG